MKSVGEVMSIGRTFEESIQKAIRSIDYQYDGFSANDVVADDEIDEELINPTDKRMFAIANAMAKGYSVDKIHKMSNIDRWFLSKLMRIMNAHKVFGTHNAASFPPAMLRQAKQLGFSDKQLAKALNSTELAVRKLRQEHAIMPFVKQIDTVAAEFPAYTTTSTPPTTQSSTTSTSATRVSWCWAPVSTASVRRSSSTGVPCVPSARCVSAASRRSWSTTTRDRFDRLRRGRPSVL